MKKIPKSSKKKKLSHAYQVCYHQWDQVEIERYQVTKVTKLAVTYFNDAGVEFELSRKGGSYKWFPTFERAQAFAVKKLEERAAFYQNLVADLQRQAKEMKARSK